MVTGSAAKLEQTLQETEYETKARGRRHLPAGRPAGEGVYAVTLEDGQMHLAYSLELPERPREVQRELKIAPEASYALSVKNPEAGQQRAAGLSKQDKADYPQKLQEEFRDRRFAREDVRLLDYEGPNSSWSGPAGIPRKRTASPLRPKRRTARTPTSSTGCGW